MSLDFGAILTRAWKITWNNKVLWIFGILAGLGSGGGSPNSGSNFSSGSGGRPELPPRIEEFFDRFEPGVLAAVIGGILCLAIIIFLVILALSIIGRGGLIGGVQIVEANGKVTFGEAWNAGLRHFWTLFLIGLLVFVVTFVLGLILIVPGIFLAAVTMGIGVVCFLPLLCVFIIAAIILGIIAYFAQIAAVLEGLSVMDALRRSWELLRANIGPIIILGIILAVVGFVINFVTFLPILLIVVPVMVSMAGFANESQVVGTTSLAIAAACFCIYLPVLLVIGGILQTWITSAWTLAYQQLTRPSAPLGSMPAPTIVHPG
jgi:hypothetical protein